MVSIGLKIIILGLSAQFLLSDPLLSIGQFEGGTLIYDDLKTQPFFQFAECSLVALDIFTQCYVMLIGPMTAKTVRNCAICNCKSAESQVLTADDVSTSQLSTARSESAEWMDGCLNSIVEDII